MGLVIRRTLGGGGRERAQQAARREEASPVGFLPAQEASRALLASFPFPSLQRGGEPHPDVEVEAGKASGARVEVETELLEAEPLLQEVAQVMLQQVAAGSLLDRARPREEPPGHDERGGAGCRRLRRGSPLPPPPRPGPPRPVSAITRLPGSAPGFFCSPGPTGWPTGSLIGRAAPFPSFDWSLGKPGG